MVDVTPMVPAGRQMVEAYGGGGFKVSGAAYQGSLLVTPEATFAWPVLGAMDTGAACRTYNVLLVEGRRVAAAPVAVA